MTDEGDTNLLDRLQRVAGALTEGAASLHGKDRQRLIGLADGVRLAMSYVGGRHHLTVTDYSTGSVGECSCGEWRALAWPDSGVDLGAEHEAHVSGEGL